MRATPSTPGDLPPGDAGERPVLSLGVVGFGPAERERIEAAVARGPTPDAQWRITGELTQADAWLVGGARVHASGAGGLQVEAGVAGEHALRLDLEQLSRPVAFAATMPDALPAARIADVASQAGIARCLREFDAELLPLRAHFALGRDVVRNGAALRHGVFRLVGDEDALLAVLDFRIGQACLRPGVTPAELAACTWLRAAAAPGHGPVGFEVMTTAQLSWTYAKHSVGTALLPAHYRQRPIHYRGTPRVPLAWVSDVQLALLRELAARPRSFDELRPIAADDERQLERALAALYLASSITSTPSKAARVRRAPKPDVSVPTVPATLDPLRR